jgi:hypothetical protein
MSFFENLFIKPSILSICFMVFTRDESDLIELMAGYLLKQAEESMKCRGCVH